MRSIALVAVSGMQAAQTQLRVSAHNVANMVTPGFRRQEVVHTRSRKSVSKPPSNARTAKVRRR